MPASVRESLNAELRCCNFQNMDLEKFFQKFQISKIFEYLDFAKYSKKYRILQN